MKLRGLLTLTVLAGALLVLATACVSLQGVVGRRCA